MNDSNTFLLPDPNITLIFNNTLILCWSIIYSLSFEYYSLEKK